ncbi:MAG: RES family NAD+ phosphorylase [Balneolales bacterium]
MTVYRITKRKYADDLSGKGAERYGGRWNNVGIPVLYTSEHRSLCLLEMLIHTPIEEIARNLMLVEIIIPDEYPAFHITTKDLSRTWKTFPYDRFTKDVGDELLRAKNHPVIRVPSALVDEEFNYLLNPKHELFNGISVKKANALELDSRFF